MKETPYEWDMLIAIAGNELLLSEYILDHATLLCPPCKRRIEAKKYKQHLIDEHGWSEVEGTINSA